MSVKEQIQTKLEAEFSPSFIELQNESHMHSVPKNSETHFKLIMVSPKFEGLGLVQRHQRVYGCLSNELKQGVHALALHLFTEGEFSQSKASHLKSPDCRGAGSKESGGS